MVIDCVKVHFFRVQAELDKDLEDMVSNLSKYEKLKEQGFYTERAREVASEGAFEERIDFLRRFREALGRGPGFTSTEDDLFE